MIRQMIFYFYNLYLFSKQFKLNIFNLDEVKVENSKIDSNCIDLLFNINNLSKFKIVKNKEDDY